jgi:hypothetical protein
MVAFISSSQFLLRYDFRWCGKNVLDNGTQAGYDDLVDPATPAGAVIAAFIAESSEVVMAAAAIGKRYTVDDLTTYGGQLLVRIVSDLVMGLILKRRVRSAEDTAAFSAAYTEALDYLEQLRRGERIFFAVPKVPEAGLMTAADERPRPGSCQPPLISENSRIFGVRPLRGECWGC